MANRTGHRKAGDGHCLASAKLSAVLDRECRECFDHVVILNAAGLRRVLTDYVEYYLRSRTHLSLNKHAPGSRAVVPPTNGDIVSIHKSVVCITATNGAPRNARATHHVAGAQRPFTKAEHNRRIAIEPPARDAFAMNDVSPERPISVPRPDSNGRITTNVGR
jgi:hypothetical protein